MYAGSAQGVIERIINVRYYYYYYMHTWNTFEPVKLYLLLAAAVMMYFFPAYLTICLSGQFLHIVK